MAKRGSGIATQFKPGQVANPAGRPKGSRNAFSEKFIGDYIAVWEEKGIAAIRDLATDDKATFVKVAASILPKEVKVQHDFADLTDAQLQVKLQELNAAIARELGSRQQSAARGGEGSGGSPTADTKH